MLGAAAKAQGLLTVQVEVTVGRTPAGAGPNVARPYAWPSGWLIGLNAAYYIVM